LELPVIVPRNGEGVCVRWRSGVSRWRLTDGVLSELGQARREIRTDALLLSSRWRWVLQNKDTGTGL